MWSGTQRTGAWILGVLLLVLASSTLAGKGNGKGGGGKPPSDDPAPDPAVVFHEGGTYGSDYADLVVMNADGSNRVTILEGGSGTLHRNPAWSPNASQIVFESNVEGTGVYVVDADGNNVEKLVGTSGLAPPAGAWSPAETADGAAKIAYVEVTPGGTRDIYLVNEDGASPLLLAETPDVSEHDVAWSPSADRIAIAGRLDGVIVYSLGLVDGELAVTGTAVVSAGALAGARVNHVDWAKTQDKLVVTARLPNESYADLWLIDLSDTANPVRLTFTSSGGSVGTASWSSDDSQIVFGRGNPDWSLYVIDSDGSGESALLLRAKKSKAPKVHPDWRR